MLTNSLLMILSRLRMFGLTPDSAAKAQGWSLGCGRSAARLRQLQRFVRRQRGIPSGSPFAATRRRLSGGTRLELLGEADEKSFGAADIAEPIRLFVLNYFADQLCATLAEPGERLVDVVHSEHDA